MKEWVEDFYKARLKEGMTINEVDKMDIAFYLRLHSSEKKKEVKKEQEANELVFIDDLGFL
jgi:hypothetical protein